MAKTRKRRFNVGFMIGSFWKGEKLLLFGVKTQIIYVTSLSAFIKTMIVLLRLPLFMV